MNTITNFRDRFVKAYLAFGTILISTMFNVDKVLADTSGVKLSDIVDTEAFQGSARWLDKFNFIGGILNFIITAVCFIGLVTVVFQMLLTVLYFGNRSFWDNTHDIKTQNAGSQLFGKATPFGLGGYLKEFVMPTKTSGLDSIFALIYIVIPDIKEYSEMGSNRDSKLNDDDSITTWLLKTSGKKIILLLLLSMGWNGSLMKCYMMIVDGLGVAANRVASYNSEALVNNILNAGDNFDFTLGSSGKGADVVQGEVASKMYKAVLAELGDENQSRDIKQTVGKNIESIVASQMNAESIRQSLVAGGYIEESYELTDGDWKSVKASIVSSSSSNTDMGRISVDMNNIVGSYKGSYLNKTMYMNIQFSLKTKAPVHNYLEVS